MKKLLFILVSLVFLMTGCDKQKPAEYTILGVYTPYENFPEKLVGKVEKITEINYWAIPQGDTYIRGDRITIKDRDSLNWTNDFEAVYDNSGDLVLCNYIDENNKSIRKRELFKENNVPVSGKDTQRDTLRYVENIKCNATGEISEIIVTRALVDTLLYTGKYTYSIKKDTITEHWSDYLGDPYARILEIYNTEGQFILTEFYDKNGDFAGAVEVKYNDRGKISNLTAFDKDKTIYSVNEMTYEYDTKGNWIKAIVTDSESGKVVYVERSYSYFE